jgi:hypothetical protein
VARMPHSGPYGRQYRRDIGGFLGNGKVVSIRGASPKVHHGAFWDPSPRAVARLFA